MNNKSGQIIINMAKYVQDIQIIIVIKQKASGRKHS